MSVEAMLSSMGYEKGKSLDDILLEEGADKFAEKHTAYLEKVRSEERVRFVGLDEAGKSRVLSKGHKPEDLEAFAKEMGAVSVTDGLITQYETFSKAQSDLKVSQDGLKSMEARMDKMEKDIERKSVTADTQAMGGAGRVESGERPTLDEPKAQGTLDITMRYIDEIL